MNRHAQHLLGSHRCLIAPAFPGNILLLRGNIEVLPRSRRTVSYEFLSQLVADYLLKTSPDVDMSAALSVMPMTQSMCCLSEMLINNCRYYLRGHGSKPTLHVIHCLSSF